MRKLKNTLYVMNEYHYLTRDRTNIVIKNEGKEIGRYPIHIFEGIICFNYTGASPSLIKLCNDNNVSIAYVSKSGHFQGRFIGKTNGNVLLRREQYRIADSEIRSLSYSKNFVIGKLLNCKNVLMRLIRDHESKIDIKRVKNSLESINTSIERISKVHNEDELRGLEGDAARAYFNSFDELIISQREDFYFIGRNRRPPKDFVNALLSFGYTFLAYEVQSALEVVGIDSYVGFFHKDRPGRFSMALDLMEELRPYLVDRFILTLINKKIITAKDFEKKENNSILLNSSGRKKFIDSWQKRKQDVITHPYINERLEVGLIPYVQAQLLARTIRKDLDQYPPFISK